MLIKRALSSESESESEWFTGDTPNWQYLTRGGGGGGTPGGKLNPDFWFFVSFDIKLSHLTKFAVLFLKWTIVSNHELLDVIWDCFVKYNGLFYMKMNWFFSESVVSFGNRMVHLILSCHILRSWLFYFEINCCVTHYELFRVIFAYFMGYYGLFYLEMN